jgi:hypothetical protein
MYVLALPVARGALEGRFWFGFNGSDGFNELEMNGGEDTDLVC